MLEQSENLPVRLDEPELPFSVSNGKDIGLPVLLSVPHAGRDYPAEILDNLNVPAANLLRLEDRYADLLVSTAISNGFTTILARRPRAWIDLNRNPAEIDPDMVDGLDSSQLPHPSRKVRGGLGLVPRRLTGVGNLWREKWRLDDIRNRIDAHHEPYHQFVGRTLKQMQEKFGGALLLDLHSMPPLDDDENGGTDIVIGDRFGSSAGSIYSELSIAFFEQAGFKGRLNHPYSGGYMLERHGDPGNGIHALQLEIDRTCYLDGNLREPGPGLEAMTDHIARLAGLLAEQIDTRFQLAAAE